MRGVWIAHRLVVGMGSLPARPSESCGVGILRIGSDARKDPCWLALVWGLASESAGASFPVPDRVGRKDPCQIDASTFASATGSIIKSIGVVRLVPGHGHYDAFRDVVGVIVGR